jgi:hypothetical protein
MQEKKRGRRRNLIDDLADFTSRLIDLPTGADGPMHTLGLGGAVDALARQPDVRAAS